MKNDFLKIVKVCIVNLIILSIVLPQLAGAADEGPFSWLNLFREKSSIVEQKEIKTELPDHQISMLGEIALLQQSAPIAFRYPQYAPYCAYKPGVSYCLTTVTAYSSTADQTDSSPFITANGKRVGEGIVACNFLTFGTKVKFPELYGNQVFSVEDRMAVKNDHKIDIWLPSRNEAKQFGIQQLKVEILN
ncbi:hypothetical protein D4R86_02320 [bacterium]|nr:MAG: hypothetical protein D4R86_02320 [bacterium]